MSANMGGTEIGSALDWVFRHRMGNKPTAVFVLTDGGSWDLTGVMELVGTWAERAKKEGSLLRTFVLGVGNEVATAMCEGIARAGKGTAVFVAVCAFDVMI